MARSATFSWTAYRVVVHWCRTVEVNVAPTSIHPSIHPRGSAWRCALAVLLWLSVRPLAGWASDEPLGLEAVAFPDPIDVFEFVGGEGNPLDRPEVRSVLAELGDGDPVMGLRASVLSTGITVAAEGSDPVYDVQVVVPGRIVHGFAPAPEPQEDGAWMSPGVAAAMADPTAGDVEVHMRVKRSLLAPMPHRYVVEEEARLRGEDPMAAREAWQVDREDRGVEGVALLAGLVAAAGGDVLEVDTRRGKVRAVVSGSALAGFASDARLASIELASEWQAKEDNAAGYWLNVYGDPIDGIEVESLVQSKQFYDAGFYAENEALGLVEPEGDDIRRSHDGFDDNTGTDRVVNLRWSGPLLWTFPNPSIGSGHSTGVASIMVGDITRGQDAGITDAWQRRRRSGVARRAGLLGMTTESASRLVTEMTMSSRDIQVVNMSAGTGGDALCEGRDDWSDTANELFESGVVLVKSAGNAGHGNVNDCKIGSPGSAIGAFTVGAHHPTVDGSGTVVHFGTSRGGTPTEGRGRTIMDMSAPTVFEFPYTGRDDCSFEYGRAGKATVNCPSPGATFGQTSGATPMVAGGFALMHSFYRTIYGSPSPGAIHALMLLMGDRRQLDGTFLTAGYDSVWGAGRLRLRRVDATGLDAPLRWTLGSACVPHNQSLLIPITTADVTSDVDVLKAVSYLYDARHDDTGSVNNDQVGLSLMREYSPGLWTSVASDFSTDNKKRVFVYNPTPGRYALLLTGTSVGATNEGGCGSQEMRVWYSYMHEDSDRDDGGSALDTVRPEDEDIE